MKKRSNKAKLKAALKRLRGSKEETPLPPVSYTPGWEQKKGSRIITPMDPKDDPINKPRARHPMLPPEPPDPLKMPLSPTVSLSSWWLFSD